MAVLGKRKIDELTEEGMFRGGSLVQGTKSFPSGLSATGTFNPDGSLNDGRLVTREYVSQGKSKNGCIEKGVVIYDKEIEHGEFGEDGLKHGTIISDVDFVEHGKFKDNNLLFGTEIIQNVVSVGISTVDTFEGVSVEHENDAVTYVSIGTSQKGVLENGLSYMSEDDFCVLYDDNQVIRYQDNQLQKGITDEDGVLVAGTCIINDTIVQMGEYEEDELVSGVEFNSGNKTITASKRDHPNISFKMQYQGDELVLVFPHNVKKRIVTLEDPAERKRDENCEEINLD